MSKKLLAQKPWGDNILDEIKKNQIKAMSANEIEIFESGNGMNRLPRETVFEQIKRNFVQMKDETSGQGAAEYILLFGGVIVIALAGLLIYRSYFSNNTSGLNATQDINSIRNNMSNVL